MGRLWRKSYRHGKSRPRQVRQNIQDLLEKVELLIQHGVKAVWTVEPYTHSIFVTTKDGNTLIYNQTIESEGVKVDFPQVFS